VFQARQVSLNRPVALKMILSGQLANETAVKRFDTEVGAAANLDHSLPPTALPPLAGSAFWLCFDRRAAELTRFPSIWRSALRYDRPTHPESNAEFGAPIADPRFVFVHGSHGQAQLGGGHIIGPATIAATGAGGGHARFGDQRQLRFGPLDD